MNLGQFKIMADWDRQGTTSPCATIPWDMIGPHEAQAMRNHSQTLLRLDHRGGLSPREALAVIRGEDLRGPVFKTMSARAAYDELMHLAEAHLTSRISND